MATPKAELDYIARLSAEIVMTRANLAHEKRKLEESLDELLCVSMATRDSAAAAICEAILGGEDGA